MPSHTGSDIRMISIRCFLGVMEVWVNAWRLGIVAIIKMNSYLALTEIIAQIDSNAKRSMGWYGALTFFANT